MNEISVRTWQERFRAGDFSSRDRAVQCEAGWYDWFCRDDALAGRLKKISGVVLGITDPFILDNYYVWFKNNCPLDGPLYDDVRFEPLTGERDGKYFVVSLDSPHERMKWALITERYGYDAPEFECGNVRDMVKYINAIAPELAQGIQPRFVLEKAAVGEYVRQLAALPGKLRTALGQRATYLDGDKVSEPVAVPISVAAIRSNAQDGVGLSSSLAHLQLHVVGQVSDGSDLQHSSFLLFMLVINIVNECCKNIVDLPQRAGPRCIDQ